MQHSAGKAEMPHFDDPHRSLEEDSAATRAWIQREEANAKAKLKTYKGRRAFASRLKALYRMGTVSVPYVRDGVHFFTERKGEQDHAVLYMQADRSATPQVLIDPNTLSKKKTTTLSDWNPSRDGKLLAHSLSLSGNDRMDIRVLDTVTGATHPDIIPDSYYPNFDSWNADGTGFWYRRSPVGTPESERKYHHAIYFHRLGTDWEHDELVWDGLKSKEDIASLSLTHDNKWYLMHVYRWHPDKEVYDIYVGESDKGIAGLTLVSDGIEAEFSCEIHRDRLYVLTNHNAPNRKVMVRDLCLNGAHGPWQDIVTESTSRIVSMTTVADALFVELQENVSSHMYRYDLLGGHRREIMLPFLGSLGAWSGEAEGTELYFGFSSFCVPHTVYRYDLAAENYVVHRALDSGIDPEDFSVEQVWYSSKDGTMIPMFLIAKKGLRKDGMNPTILYGYGGFDISITPSFDCEALVFVENGGLYAVANIRGGGEFGKAWHDAGRREKKQNVFDDFIAAGEWLIGNRYTSSSYLAGSGWSNGGLLTAAVMVQRPTLFSAMIVGAPVIDMMRYHLFDGGRYWIYDYGDPDVPEDAVYLLAYSPYHNIRDGECYPAVLILSADGDDRVSKMHACKLAARLHDANRSDRPIILRIETKAGHAGGNAISAAIRQSVDTLVFAFGELR